jgi:hypothetical protein
MSRPTFDFYDGAGPKATKIASAGWSDHLKPTIDYEI